MKKINFLNIMMFMLVISFVACIEDPQVSTITSVEDFTLTLEGVPDLIVVSDEETTVITIPFILSDEQIVATTIGVVIDEDLTTATLGEDYSISSQLVTVDGYVYAPHFRKMEYLREVAAILYSFNFNE